MCMKEITDRCNTLWPETGIFILFPGRIVIVIVSLQIRKDG